MGGDTYSILCGACHVAIEGPAEPKANDVFSCPRCGRSGKHEDVIASVKAFVSEATGRSLQESFRESMGGNKFVKFRGKPIPKVEHPFIVDLKL